MNAILVDTQPNLWELVSSIGVWIWNNPTKAIFMIVGAIIFFYILGRVVRLVLSTGPLLVFIVLLVIVVVTLLVIMITGLSIPLIPKLGQWYWNSAVEAMDAPMEIELPGKGVSQLSNNPNPNSTPNPTQPSGGLPSEPEVCTVKNGMTATFRKEANSTSESLGEIPSGTQLTLYPNDPTKFVDSNCVDEICWRGETVWQSQTGWVHGAAMDCP